MQRNVRQNVFERRCELVAGAVAIGATATKSLTGDRFGDLPQLRGVFARDSLAFVEAQIWPDRQLRGCTVNARKPDMLRAKDVSIDPERLWLRVGRRTQTR